MGSPPTPPPGGQPPGGSSPDQGVTYAAERQLIGARAITFRTQDLYPPSSLYITADDGLYVNVSNLQAGQTLTLAAQVLLPDGRLQPNVWTVQPPATGAQTAYLFPLSEGYLFNLTCSPTPGTRRGSTWIYAAIRRGGLAGGYNLQTLLSDYVDSFSGPTWPGGQLHNSTDGPGLMVSNYVGNLAVGVLSYTYTVPSYARVKIHAIYAALNTGATVATRGPILFFQDPTNVIYLDTVEATQAASSYQIYSWGLLLGWGQTAAVRGDVTRGLPDLVLNPGQNFVLQGNLQSTDNWSQIYVSTEQWFSL